MRKVGTSFSIPLELKEAMDKAIIKFNFHSQSLFLEAAIGNYLEKLWLELKEAQDYENR